MLHFVIGVVMRGTEERNLDGNESQLAPTQLPRKLDDDDDNNVEILLFSREFCKRVLHRSMYTVVSVMLNVFKSFQESYLT